MAVAINITSDRALKKLIAESKPGSYRVNEGLYIQLGKTGTSSWIFRFQLAGKRREMGLGAYPPVSLLEARQAAEDARRLVAQGIDPIENRAAKNEAEKAQVGKSKTFKTCALEYIEAHRAGWSNIKHAQQWESTLATYAFPLIGDRPISTINTDDILAVLKPIWTTKNETASRVRNRIELIIAAAKARRFFEGENPAQWKGHLDTQLPKRRKVAKVEHHAALPYIEIPSFMAALREEKGIAALALQMVILTASRTSEVLNAAWQEIELDAALWTIPAERMKARKEQKVPLAPAVISLLKQSPRVANNPYVFPGMKEGKPLSNLAMLMLLRRMGRGDLTVHGFRSTFRDWAAESTQHQNFVVEMALAHQVSNAVEAAYRRGDLFEKRKALMADWADYCEHLIIPTAHREN